MARRSGLGRGLGALIPAEPTNAPGSGLRDIALARIRPNPHQPRTHFDEEALASLVDSIRAVGVLQPVLVRDVGEGEYELIAGERRCRAARRAGLLSIPALVQVADDAASLEEALVENLHREDLNPLDEAAAYARLADAFGLSHEAIALRLGRSRPAVTNAIRLLQLPAPLQASVASGELNAGQARALLALRDEAEMIALGRRAAHDALTVRAVEEAVQQLQAEPAPSPPPRPAAAATPLAPDDEHLRRGFEQALGLPVTLQRRRTGGRLIVDFADDEDLDGLYHRLGGPRL